jgi:hypothetical protein
MLSSFLANNFFFSSNRRAKESEHKQVAFAQIVHHKMLVEGVVVCFPGPPTPSSLLHGLLRPSSPRVSRKARIPDCSQRSLSGVSIFSCVASGREVRRAISLLLLQKASFTTSVYASCQPMFAIQRFFRAFVKE